MVFNTCSYESLPTWHNYSTAPSKTKQNNLQYSGCSWLKMTETKMCFSLYRNELCLREPMGVVHCLLCLSLLTVILFGNSDWRFGVCYTVFLLIVFLQVKRVLFTLDYPTDLRTKLEACVTFHKHDNTQGCTNDLLKHFSIVQIVHLKNYKMPYVSSICYFYNWFFFFYIYTWVWLLSPAALRDSWETKNGTLSNVITVQQAWIRKQSCSLKLRKCWHDTGSRRRKC